MDRKKEFLNMNFECKRIGHDDCWRILSLGVLDEEKNMLVLRTYQTWVTNEEKDIFMFPIRTVGWRVKERKPRVVGIYIYGYLIRVIMSLETEGNLENGECMVWWKLLELVIPTGLLKEGYEVEDIKELSLKMIEIGEISKPQREEAKEGTMDISEMTVKLKQQGKIEPQYTLDEALMAESVRVQDVDMKFIQEKIKDEDIEWLEKLKLPGTMRNELPTFSFWVVNKEKDIFLYCLGGRGYGEYPKYFGLYIQGYNVQIETFLQPGSQTEKWKLNKIVGTKGLMEHGYTPYKLVKLIKDLFKIYSVNRPDGIGVKQVEFPHIATPIIVEGGEYGEL